MLHTQNISSIYDGYSNIQNIQNTLITELSERVTVEMRQPIMEQVLEEHWRSVTIS